MKKVLNILGDITSQPWGGEGISAKYVTEELSKVSPGDDLEININSYGGEVFEAVAIANLIASNKAKKSFNILGICASAATMLFSPTDNVNIHRGAMVMYHKPLVNVYGNSIELKKTAKLLDKIEINHIVNGLIARTGKTSEEIAGLISGEWWLSSEEAILILGFVDSELNSIENTAKTKQELIYNNYIEKKKALSNNAYHRFINYKNSLKR